VLGSTSKIMMDYSGSGNLLYLPLDKLMQRAGVEAGAGAAQPPTLDAPSTTDSDPRSRDTLRGRGRGGRP
jgi:membrane protease subunit HflK